MKKLLLMPLFLLLTGNLIAQNYVPDSSFNFTGVRNYNVFSNIDRSFGVAVQPDGKFVAVGLSRNPGTSYFELCFSRFNTDGSLDNSFASGGVRKVSMGMQQSIGGQAPKVKIDSEGRFVACNAGNSGNGGLDMMICRLDSTGDLDNSFNSTGILFIDMTGTNAYPDLGSALDFDASGNIWVAGVTRNGGTPLDNQFAVVKVKPNGTLDSSFDLDGKKLYNLTPSPEFGLGIAVQSDSKIVVGGTAGSMYLFRIDSTGVLDLTFNVTGTRLLSIGASSSMIDLELDSLERIVVYGNSGTTSLGLARVLPNGTYDSTFAVNGVKILSIGGQNSEPGEIEIVAGNKILLSGIVNTLTGGDDFFVARINENGGTDATFNGIGYVSYTVSSGIANDQAVGMGVFPDGKIIVSGTTVFSSAINEDMAFLKLKPVVVTTGVISAQINLVNSICPNPATNSITLNSKSAGLVTIYNLLGQEMLTCMLHAGLNTISIAVLPSGTYILRDSTSGNALRFIKQ